MRSPFGGVSYADAEVVQPACVHLGCGLVLSGALSLSALPVLNLTVYSCVDGAITPGGGLVTLSCAPLVCRELIVPSLVFLISSWGQQLRRRDVLVSCFLLFGDSTVAAPSEVRNLHWISQSDLAHRVLVYCAPAGSSDLWRLGASWIVQSWLLLLSSSLASSAFSFLLSIWVAPTLK